MPKIIDLKEPFEIADDIKVCSSKKSYEAEAFFNFIKNHELPEIGEADNYSLCLVLNSHYFSTDFSEPYSLLNRFTNILAVNMSCPIVEGNVIETSNDFKSVRYVGQHFTFSHAKFEHFQDCFDKINFKTLLDIKTTWLNYSTSWEDDKSLGRISNALTFYYNAWNSPYMESFCINLSIVFELLFAPHSHSETAHQISFNVSRFISNSRKEREAIYKLMKRFYSRRSSIIHGGLPDEDKIVQPTKDAFQLCSKILKKILIDSDLIKTFNDEKQRKDLMNSFVFN